MRHLEINLESMTLGEQIRFKQFCKKVIDRITASAPSDSIVKMVVDFDGREYLANINVVSSDLCFSFVENASSPFVAMERVQKDTLEKIRKWIARRDLQVF